MNNKKNTTNGQEPQAYQHLPEPIYKPALAQYKKTLKSLVTSHDFIYLVKNNKNALLYHCATGLFWPAKRPYSDAMNCIDAAKKLGSLTIETIGDWRLPTAKEIWGFAKAGSNPCGSDDDDRLFGQRYYTWTKGDIDLVTKYNARESTDTENVQPINDKLTGIDGLLTLGQVGFTLKAVKGDIAVDAISPKSVIANCLSQLDSYSSKLPEIKAATLLEASQGLWEYYQSPLAPEFVIGRDPRLDISHEPVAIDFGTSSTVVAMANNGKTELLRIGGKDFWQAPQAKDYENPTVLEVVDLVSANAQWHTDAYRPALKWGDLRCSHEALFNYRDNQNDLSKVGSYLVKLKQWALRRDSDLKVYLSDQVNGDSIQLPTLTTRNPVKGQPLNVSEQDPLDPIELYAYFLGLNINWRGRGLFLNYQLTFPVAYPNEIKQAILASFRRGLQRSFPKTLIGLAEFNDFKVVERASEPVAYAAVAMPALNIEPTTQGIAYGVFDFGGGTSDFDFGFYRLATAAEENDGYEEVFEHFGCDGDPLLGGENLLERLAYLLFSDNIELFRTNKVVFSQPLGCITPAGAELLITDSRAASANMLTVANKLRDFWERGEITLESGLLKLNLLDQDNQAQSMELVADQQKLAQLLEDCISKGIINFLSALSRAFTDEMPNEIQLLLAGNSTRSPVASQLFQHLAQLSSPQKSPKQPLGAEEGLAVALGEIDEMGSVLYSFSEKNIVKIKSLFDTMPKFVVHLPLTASDDNPSAPSAKTGVALGLLALDPANAIKTINHLDEICNDEAPFRHYLGAIKLRKFVPLINKGDKYHQWVELGAIREKVFSIAHSQAAISAHGQLSKGDSVVNENRLRFSGNTDGHRLFAKAIAPNKIIVASALDLAAVKADNYENAQELELS